MNNMKRIIVTLICTVLLCTLLAPVSVMAATTYTFSKIQYIRNMGWNKPVTYPDSSQKVRLIVDGDNVTFLISAIRFK